MPVPNFGASGFVSRNRSRGAEQLTYIDGFDRTLYWLKESGSISVTTQTCDSYGIQGSSENVLGQALETVTLSEEENVQVHENWTGEQPASGVKLIGVDCILITHAQRNLSVNGDGALPTGYTETDRGTSGKSLSLQAVIGTASVSVSDGFVANVSDSDSQTDFRKFTFELQEFIPQTDGTGQTHLITADIPSDVKATFYKISKTTTLSREDFASVETSIEEYFGLTQGAAWPTS